MLTSANRGCGRHGRNEHGGGFVAATTTMEDGWVRHLDGLLFTTPRLLSPTAMLPGLLGRSRITASEDI